MRISRQRIAMKRRRRAIPGGWRVYSTEVTEGCPYAPHMSLGAELRKARLLAKLSQEKLAFAAELDRSYISMVERDIHSPTVNALFRICRALNIRASDLLKPIEPRPNAKTARR